MNYEPTQASQINLTCCHPALVRVLYKYTRSETTGNITGIYENLVFVAQSSTSRDPAAFGIGGPLYANVPLVRIGVGPLRSIVGETGWQKREISCISFSPTAVYQGTW